MKELIQKIKQFEEKSGLKLYNEILDDLWKMQMKLEELKKSREKWKERALKSPQETKGLKDSNSTKLNGEKNKC